jgi:riboflavin synthase
MGQQVVAWAMPDMDAAATVWPGPAHPPVAPACLGALPGLHASMFTGIIEGVGRVASVEHASAGLTLAIDCGPLAADARLGDSVAIQGICLTVIARTGDHLRFDVSPETCRVTTIATWRVGDAVNAERALRFGDRLGGHLVAGHVDGIGALVARQPRGDGEELTFSVPETVRVVEKGSLAIDGVSLTTIACRPGRCSVAVIPHTLGHTTLGGLAVGAPVNLEQDLIGRWVERLLRPDAAAPDVAR